MSVSVSIHSKRFEVKTRPMVLEEPRRWLYSEVTFKGEGSDCAIYVTSVDDLLQMSEELKKAAHDLREIIDANTGKV